MSDNLSCQSDQIRAQHHSRLQNSSLFVFSAGTSPGHREEDIITASEDDARIQTGEYLHLH